MKKLKYIAIIALVAALGACSKVPAGNVGVKVYLLGNSKGVDTEELSVGRYYIGINEELYLFPTFTQNYVWTKDPTEGSENDESISFQTKEGMVVNADVGISYHIDPKKVSLVFQKYRRGIDEITDTFLRNMVRDALVNEASNMPIENVYGAGKKTLIDKVQSSVASQVKDIGIVIEKIYWIGELRLPPTVTAALNAKIAATQKAQQRENEVAQAKAEAQKSIAIAQGEAESLKLKRSQLSPELIELKKLEVQEKVIEKWDGNLPTYTGGTIPFVSVGK